MAVCVRMIKQLNCPLEMQAVQAENSGNNRRIDVAASVLSQWRKGSERIGDTGRIIDRVSAYHARGFGIVRKTKCHVHG